MTLVVGLTGSIATGKSTISAMFKEWGFPVVDADLIAREVVKPGEKAYRAIVDHFGEEVLEADLTINRKALGKKVFENEEERKALNEIIHPEIRRKMLTERDQYKKQNEALVVMDIPLLFESELFDYVDRVLVVYISPELQKQRLIARDESTEAEALERINAQIPVTEKRDRADAIIDNGGTVEDSKQQLKQLLSEWNIYVT
ncbi:dephospho-CoA kinase [Halalkalibacillus halophilus]|uniref:dephospho-CoA kinase n=1 Tax=Halalkalibacillus halophilus TaxID=392827 RepID=UPI0004086BA8|nr:dephospho-CoA kinase [Halalkalibacillus halophilus]